MIADFQVDHHFRLDDFLFDDEVDDEAQEAGNCLYYFEDIMHKFYGSMDKKKDNW